MVYLMGADAEEILITFGLTEDESKSYAVVKQRFQDYFLKMTNIIFERAQFNLRCQKEGEPAAEFVTDLYKKAETLNYGQLKDELIRDRIVVGILDKQLSKKLMLMADLTLGKVKEMVFQSEKVNEQ